MGDKSKQRFVRRHKIFPDYYIQTLNAANRIPIKTRDKLEKLISSCSVERIDVKEYVFKKI